MLYTSFTQKVTLLERLHVTGPDDHDCHILQLKGKDEHDNDDRDRSVEEITLMCTTFGYQHNISMVYTYIYICVQYDTRKIKASEYSHGRPFGFWAEPMM